MSKTFYCYEKIGNGWREPSSVQNNNKRRQYLNIDDDNPDKWPKNAYYDSRLDVNLAEMNAHEILTVLNLSAESDPITVNEFAMRITNALRRRIGSRSPAIPESTEGAAVDESGPTIINCGRREGYVEETLMRLRQLANAAREYGATHIGWA